MFHDEQTGDLRNTLARSDGMPCIQIPSTSDNIYCEKEEGYYSDEYQYQDPFAEHDTSDLERITSRLDDCVFQAMAIYIQIEKNDFEIHQEPLYDVADIVVKSKQ
ncbi:hypothetical protein PS6_006091 [Mucor atramentarius]